MKRLGLQWIKWSRTLFQEEEDIYDWGIPLGIVFLSLVAVLDHFGMEIYILLFIGLIQLLFLVVVIVENLSRGLKWSFNQKNRKVERKTLPLLKTMLSTERYEEFLGALYELQQEWKDQGYSLRQVRWHLRYQKVGMLSFILKEKFRKFLVNRKIISRDT